MVAKFFTFVFVVKVKKNDTIIRDGAAIAALFFPFPVLLAAESTPIVNDPIISAAYIFFESSLVKTVHFSIRLLRMQEQAVNDRADALIALRVLLLHFYQSAVESFGGHINKCAVLHIGTKQPGFLGGVK